MKTRQLSDEHSARDMGNQGMSGLFDGKVVFLTGAGSAIGIGRATALAFAREGARIAAVDVTVDDLAETVDLIRAVGAGAKAFQADVSKSAEVDRAVAAATEEFGEIHILVSNAGIAKKKAFIALTDEDWQRTMTSTSVGPCIAPALLLPR